VTSRRAASPDRDRTGAHDDGTTDETGPGRYIADVTSLEALLVELTSQPAIALDTEFHRERTYYPQLALLQLAWDGGSALVDPIRVDVGPLARLLDSDIEWVLHAAQQDLEVLGRACGTIPRRLFDTQVAAGFVGYSTPSLATLATGEISVTLPKADRLTDWLRRPLTAEQRQYALADVDHLLTLRDRLVEQLTHRGRLEWALTECEQLRTRPNGPGDPDDAWLKIKDHRSLRGPSRGVARAVAGWRERRAASLDQPVRFVLSDMALLGIAQRPPKNLEDLVRVRGLDDKLARGALGAEIMAAVTAGLATPAPAPAADTDDMDRKLRPAVALVSAWISQRSRDVDIDTPTLATRGDLVALLSGDSDARLAHGWRADLVGHQIADLVAGRAALSFDGAGKLVLEPRIR
jgi:ribonuclease D